MRRNDSSSASGPEQAAVATSSSTMCSSSTATRASASCRVMASDVDTDLPFGLGDLEGAQPELRRAGVLAGGDPVLEAVPGAHDVRVIGVEGQPQAVAVVVEALADTVDDAALADRTALVRAGVLVGVEG